MQKPPSTKVGAIFTSNKGDKAVVTIYLTSKNITVQFADGAIVTTTQANLKRGAFSHPTKYKMYAGEKFINKRGEIVMVKEYVSATNIKVIWEDGEQGNIAASELRTGSFRHPNNWKFKVGEKVKVSRGLIVEVVEFNSATDVLVKFADGVVVKTVSDCLRKKSLEHPEKGVRTGQTFKTNSGWICTVSKYVNSSNVYVVWQDGSESIETTANLKDGTIRPLMQPSLEGIGYFGIGRFVPDTYKVGLKADKKIVGFWVRMINRCYNPHELNKPQGACYRDIHVCKEWHNFQNFAEWAVKQPYVFGENSSLDKDCIKFGNKVYSPDVCCFLPLNLNIFFSDSQSTKYAKGVNIIKPKNPKDSVGYVARCHNDGEREYLGFFPTVREAALAYKQRKEFLAREYAKLWADRLDPRAIESFMNYEVLITD